MLVKYFFKLFFEALSNFLSRTRLCCFVSFAATLIFYQSLSGLSSTFFIFLIPSPDRLDDSLTACISQAPLFLRFRRNVWYLTTSLSFCQQLFWFIFQSFHWFLNLPVSFRSRMSRLRVFFYLPLLCCFLCCSSATKVILSQLFLIVNVFYIFHVIQNILKISICVPRP